MTPTTNAAAGHADIKTARLVPWLLFLIFFAVLNETVFNVSTPKVAEQFGLGAATVSWMMTIFMVIFGIGSVVYGKLADSFSLRSLITAGVALYAAGSLLGFLGQSSYALVVAGRAVQGAGASAIPALVFVAVARYFPPERRGQVFGLITAVVSLSIGIGPVLGGFVSSVGHWSYLFAVPLLTLAALPFLWRALPAEGAGAVKLDWLGGLLVSALVAGLVLFLNRGDWYWAAGTVAVALAALLRFRLAGDPFIDPSLFAERPYRNGVVAGFVLFSIVLGALFVVPLMLHAVHRLDTAQIGLALFPGAISAVVFGPLGGRLADRKGNRFAIGLGLALLTLSLAAMAVLLPLGPAVAAVALFFTYVGFSFFQTALVNGMSQSLPPERTGVGMGVFNLISIVSGALGTALVAKLLDGGTLAAPLVPHLGAAEFSPYANLLAAFALLVAAAGLWYLATWRPGNSGAAESEAGAASTPRLDACLDCE